MSAPNPIILLLEDCPVTGLLIERVIFHKLPEVRLIWARSLMEARERSEGLPISLFILDIMLPDGSGLEFLDHAAVTHPEACAIVVTATRLPQHRAMSAALGALHFIEKPLKPAVLLEKVLSALGANNPESAARDFRATLQNVTPMDILQLKCLSGASTLVEFRYDAITGTIRFKKGEVVDARAGSLRGIDAVREIISWPRGHVFEHGDVGEYERTIECSWQALLMEAAQAIDEYRANTIGA